MNTQKTGEFIAQLRRERNLTQSQLGELLHVSDKAISRWETGRGFPDVSNLEAISEHLDVSVAELLRGERIAEAVSKEELRTIESEGLSLTNALLNRRKFANILLGFLLGLLLLSIAVVHLMSPVYLKYADGLVRIDELNDGSVVAVLDDSVTGYEVERLRDPDSGETQVFLGCYRTAWSRLSGRQREQTLALLGNRDEIAQVWYYPTDGGDRLLYGAEGSMNGGVQTLPRLIYNTWLLIGLCLSAAGLMLWALLRKKYFAPRLLNLALLPVAFTLSIPLCLFGRFDEVYNASYDFTGILLLTAVIYLLLRLLLLRGVKKR